MAARKTKEPKWNSARSTRSIGNGKSEPEEIAMKNMHGRDWMEIDQP
jgi:hypothetical protein